MRGRNVGRLRVAVVPRGGAPFRRRLLPLGLRRIVESRGQIAEGVQGLVPATLPGDAPAHRAWRTRRHRRAPVHGWRAPACSSEAEGHSYLETLAWAEIQSTVVRACERNRAAKRCACRGRRAMHGVALASGAPCRVLRKLFGRKPRLRGSPLRGRRGRASPVILHAQVSDERARCARQVLLGWDVPGRPGWADRKAVLLGP